MTGTHRDPNLDMQLQRGAEHVTRLGARVAAELLAAIGERAGCMPLVIELLDDYRRRLNQENVRAARADRFPRRIRARSSDRRLP